MISKIQDIHASDVDKWNDFLIFWDDGNYQAALNFLQNNSDLLYKYCNAQWLNNLTNCYTDLQEDKDPLFKQDIIKVSIIPPPLNVGEIYFQITFNLSEYIALEYAVIPAGDTSVSISLPNNSYLLQYGAFIEQELVTLGVRKNGNAIQFLLPEAINAPVTCMVIRTKGTGWTRQTGNLSSTNTIINYTGNLIGYNCTTTDINYGITEFVELNTSLGNGSIEFIQFLTGNNITWEVVTHSTLQLNHSVTLNPEEQINTNFIEIFGDMLGFRTISNNNRVITDVKQVSNRLVFSIKPNIDNSSLVVCSAGYDENN